MHEPTQRERRQVAALAVVSLVVLACLGSLHLFVPPAVAPRVNVRWVPDLSDAVRIQHERELKLLAGEHLEEMTWSYDLADPSPQAVRAIVNNASVEDTGHIDRSRGIVSSDAPLGSTRIHGGLSSWRDASIGPWLRRCASFVLVLSALWLVTTGRRTRHA
jgi:hypothetical protein